MTAEEQARLLKVSGEHRDGFRDHVMLSLALGAGLRISELVALDVEDVTSNGKTPHRTLYLRVFKRAGQATLADAKAQSIPLPDGTFYKLEKYLRGLPPGASGPLFQSRIGKRLSIRSTREMFMRWQAEAGFPRPFTFHELRHTAITNLYRDTGDVRLAQRFARHAKLDTTTIYAHVSEEDLAKATKRLAS